MIEESQPPKRLQWKVSVLLLAGAAGSLIFFLGHARNTPALLIFLYVGWILLPFAGVQFTRLRMSRRPGDGGFIMNAAALIVVIKALVVYGGFTFLPNSPRPAAVFLLMPLASWVFIALAYVVAAIASRKASSPLS